MEAMEDKNAKDFNVVMLGTGQSGKSTLYHQLAKIYMKTSITERMNGYSHQTKGILRQNIVGTINLILKKLATAADNNDPNCNMSSLDLLKVAVDDRNTNLETYFDEFFMNAQDIHALPWTMECLARDIDDLASGQTIRSGKTEPEIRQELNDIVDD
eukprot:292036_1